MAKRGESKVRKRITAPRAVNVSRKGDRFIMKPSPGPHPIEASVPLGVAIRDLLKMADSAREVKRMLNECKIFVDGKVVKAPNYPLGFMDVLTMPSVNRFYRVVYDTKGRIRLLEIEPKNSQFKLCKVRGKTVIRKGKTQLNLHDGKNILSDKEFKTGDVLKVEIPSMKVSARFPMQKGNVAYVTGGKHAGRTATIEEIVPGTMARKPLVVLNDGGSQFQTRKGYVFVIGEKEPAIRME